MTIVENAELIPGNRALVIDIMAKNIIQRLSQVGVYSLQPNTFIYPHGTTEEIECYGVKMLCHTYRAIHTWECELSIEYTTP